MTSFRRLHFFCMFVKESVNLIVELLGMSNDTAKYENTLCHILKWKHLAALRTSRKLISEDERRYRHLKLVKMIQSVCAKDLDDSCNLSSSVMLLKALHRPDREWSEEGSRTKFKIIGDYKILAPFVD